MKDYKILVHGTTSFVLYKGDVIYTSSNNKNTIIASRNAVSFIQEHKNKQLVPLANSLAITSEEENSNQIIMGQTEPTQYGGGCRSCGN